MVYFADAQTWSQQSILLLQARPTTTRITTKYKISKPTTSSKPINASSKRHPTSTSTSTETHTPSTTQPRALLILKTYDPVSGICLKHKTDKAADVGRLIGGLGRCGRAMAALPVEAGPGSGATGGGGAMGAADGEVEKRMDVDEGTATPTPVSTAAAVSGTSGPGGAGGGGGKKKKKGKK
ncbi:hypothetical protein MMC25_004837 [Agyrium rufum]|nr:hypothetical protein [Agyrium rufum]